MNCRKCGAIVPDGSSNCSVCGAPVAPAAPQYAQAGSYGAAPVRPSVPTAAPAPAQRCPQCGGELAPNARFCGNCGASFAAAPVSPRPVAPKPVAKGNFLSKVTTFLTNGPSFTVAGKTFPVYGAVAAGVALVLVIVLLFSLFGGNSPESIAETYIEAYYFGDCDGDDFVDLYHEDYVEWLLDEYDIDLDELIDALDEEMEDNRDELEDEEIELDKIEIRSVKDKKRKDYEYLIDTYEDEYDLEIEEIKLVKCKVHYEQDGDEETNNVEVLVAKIDGSYYLINSALAAAANAAS